MKSLVFAHRGASRYAPENTMPAFELAYKMKSDGIEMDVQLTKDDVPVIIHDEELQRTTNGKGFVKDHTFEEIKALDAGILFSKKYKVTVIPSLEEVLQWAKDKRLYLNIELKNNKIDYKNIEAIVLDIIKKYNMTERTIISSFNSASIKRMRQLDSDLDIALLRSKPHVDLTQLAKDLGASSLNIHYKLLNDLFVEQCRNSNLPVRIYTVNRRRAISHCYRLRCSGVITDVPDKALKLRNKFHLRS